MLVSVTRKLPPGVRIILTGACRPVVKVCGWHQAGDASSTKGISDFIDMQNSNPEIDYGSMEFRWSLPQPGSY
jgi:hypothetical protein